MLKAVTISINNSKPYTLDAFDYGAKTAFSKPLPAMLANKSYNTCSGQQVLNGDRKVWSILMRQQ